MSDVEVRDRVPTSLDAVFDAESPVLDGYMRYILWKSQNGTKRCPGPEERLRMRRGSTKATPVSSIRGEERIPYAARRQRLLGGADVGAASARRWGIAQCIRLRQILGKPVNGVQLLSGIEGREWAGDVQRVVAVESRRIEVLSQKIPTLKSTHLEGERSSGPVAIRGDETIPCPTRRRRRCLLGGANVRGRANAPRAHSSRCTETKEHKDNAPKSGPTPRLTTIKQKGRSSAQTGASCGVVDVAGGEGGVLGLVDGVWIESGSIRTTGLGPRRVARNRCCGPPTCDISTRDEDAHRLG
ncbi:hypothetical protein C8R46DRAFT_1039706 [Mycena filopes]|nr:hypothetical protein C8R46DRAFT_1039706 [Mycena filopes]